MAWDKLYPYNPETSLSTQTIQKPAPDLENMVEKHHTISLLLWSKKKPTVGEIKNLTCLVEVLMTAHFPFR